MRFTFLHRIIQPFFISFIGYGMITIFIEKSVYPLLFIGIFSVIVGLTRLINNLIQFRRIAVNDKGVVITSVFGRKLLKTEWKNLKVKSFFTDHFHGIQEARFKSKKGIVFWLGGFYLFQRKVLLELDYKCIVLESNGVKYFLNECEIPRFKKKQEKIFSKLNYNWEKYYEVNSLNRNRNLLIQVLISLILLTISILLFASFAKKTLTGLRLVAFCITAYFSIVYTIPVFNNLRYWIKDLRK